VRQHDGAHRQTRGRQPLHRAGGDRGPGKFPGGWLSGPIAKAWGYPAVFAVGTGLSAAFLLVLRRLTLSSGSPPRRAPPRPAAPPWGGLGWKSRSPALRLALRRPG